jgi:hypothetical protein
MDPSRIVLLVAVGAFFALLMFKLRPRAGSPDSEPRGRLHPESRLYKRIRRLPREAQRRLAARLTRDLADDEADEGDGEGPD